MATSAPAGDALAVPKPKVQSRKAKQAADALAQLQAAEDEDSDEVLDEVKETHCIRHGNIRQRLRHGMKYTMYSAKFSPDGHYLATSNSDKTVCLWDLKTSKEVASWEHQDYVRCLAFSPDGSKIITGCDDKFARIYKVEEKGTQEVEPEKSMEHTDWVVGVCYSSNSEMVCTVARNQSVMIHNLRPRRGGSKRHTTLGGSKERAGSKERDDSKERPGSKERADSKERSPSKERSDSKEDRAGSKTRAGSKIHEEPPRTLPHDDQTLGACFSENCEMIVTASGWEHGHAVVFDLQSLDEILRIPHSDWVMQASFSPVNCMYVLTACKDKTARVWELPKAALYGQARQDAKDAKARAEQEEKEAQAGKKKLVVSKKKSERAG